MDTAQVKKIVLKAIPIAIPFYFGDKFSEIWRALPANKEMIDKALLFLENVASFTDNPVPSLYSQDILVGAVAALGFNAILYYRHKNAKKYRKGQEYGDASWGTPNDIKPYVDRKRFENNVILTATESLTMGKPSKPKYARNKNVLVIGGSGSGKTRFFVKPNLMQMHSSYVVTDPKGTVLVECGKMLQKGRAAGKKDKYGNEIYEPYKIKVFNTVDFSKSMHYNPFAYIREETREQDILKFVEVLIKNTSGGNEQKGDDFWVKAERLLYTAYIAMIFCLSPKEEQNFETLIDMINDSECREDDEEFKNAIDWQFEAVEKWINNDIQDTDVEIIKTYGGMREIEPTAAQKRIGKFAVKQYKAYKLAAGKTAKSILISCSARLATFSIDAILDITSYDEMELDKIGDELTALFVIVPDTDDTFNFLVSIMYTQMFNLLCTKADNNPDGSGALKYPVRCILDEFANIGLIPNFEKLIATIRSRGISAAIILQSKSQLKALYKDNADTIEGNCDTTLFLGGKEKSTLKEISELLGKETIDDYDTSESRGQSQSTTVNNKKLGKELMSQDALSRMDGGKCILMLRGLRPFLSDKYDITKHKNYYRLKDADSKKGMYLEEYIKVIFDFMKKPKTKTYQAENYFEKIEKEMEYRRLKKIVDRYEGRGK